MTAICESFGEFISGPSDIWEDNRDQENETGYAIHKPSDDQYGHLNESDNDLTIRIKMATLFFTLPLLGIVKLKARAVHLLAFGWIRNSAYPEALLEWNARRIELFLQNSSEPLPTKLDLYRLIAEKSLDFFVDSLKKTVLLPVAIFLQMGACLAGLINPLAGRRLFNQIEETFFIKMHKPSLLGAFMNFSAPCMHPKRVWEEQNLYQFYRSKDSPSHYEKICHLKRFIKMHAAYFPEKSEDWQGALKKLYCLPEEKLGSFDQIEEKLTLFLQASDEMVETGNLSFDRQTSLSEITELLDQLRHDPV